MSAKLGPKILAFTSHHAQSVADAMYTAPHALASQAATVFAKVVLEESRPTNSVPLGTRA